MFLTFAFFLVHLFTHYLGTLLKTLRKTHMGHQWPRHSSLNTSGTDVTQAGTNECAEAKAIQTIIYKFLSRATGKIT